MNVILSNNSKEPLYEQIKNQIKAQILSGKLQEGEDILSMRALARDLQVSVITTKRAYDDLEQEGFLSTIPGKGTYVASQNQELLKERKLKQVEDILTNAVETAQVYEIAKDELIELLNLLWESE
ncbi:MAG: GntR family transcriptional regulator [Tissierellia bacterium]|nr:GntR family transcriptional regulator [Tissierellia bacterium]